MAQVKYSMPIENISGKLGTREQNSPVMRHKTYRDGTGKIIAEGVNEAYVVKNPRDYRKNPPTGEEARNISLFGQAVALAKAERANPERLAYWTNRWNKQLKKGEPDAPICPATGKPRIYHRLDIFIQSAIQRALKSGTWGKNDLA